MGYSVGSYGKGFFVNTSAVAAKGLDVSRDSRTERILTVAIKEERAVSAYNKAVEKLALSDEAFLRSLEDGSFFSQNTAPSYKGSSYKGSSYNGGYSGGSYGQFINSTESAGEDDLARYGLGVNKTNSSFSQTSTTQVERSYTVVETESTLEKIKAFLLKHKFYVLAALILALIVALRKK